MFQVEITIDNPGGSSNCCRVCLQSLKEENLLSLFDKIGEKTILFALENLTDIKDIEHDYFTKRICEKCAEHVRMAFNIRQKCLEADAKLKHMFNEEIKKLVPDDLLALGNDSGPQLIQDETFLDEIGNIDIPYDNTFEEPLAEYKNEITVESENGKNDVQEEPIRHYCCRCTETFAEEEELVLHFRSEHPQYHRKLSAGVLSRKDKVQCQLCGSNVKDLKVHRMLQHSLGPAAFQCNECGKTYRTIRSLQNCSRKHRGTKTKLKCPKCPSLLSTRSGLYNHLKLHNETQRNRCDICGRLFLHLSHLNQHVAGHSGDRRVECEVCEAKVTRGYLKIHMRIHTGERPYKCNYCEKAFIHNTDWKRHEMMHTGERPYKCSVSSCTMGFVKKSYLTHHMTRAHPNYHESDEIENTTAPKVVVVNRQELSDYAFEEVFADDN